MANDPERRARAELPIKLQKDSNAYSASVRNGPRSRAAQGKKMASESEEGREGGRTLMNSRRNGTSPHGSAYILVDLSDQAA